MPPLRCQLRPRYLAPDLESSCAFLPVGHRLQAMAARTAMVSNQAMGGEKALGMAGGFEATHGPFSLASRLVRILRPIVQPSMLAMLDTRQYLTLGSPVACKLIGNNHVRCVRAAFQESAEELPCCGLVSPALHTDVEHDALLVNRSPEIVLFAVDLQEAFIQVPLVSKLRTSAPKFVGILLTELPRPPSHGFIAEHNAASRYPFLDISEAQREPEVEPHSMRDDVRRIPMPFVGWCGSVCLHAVSIA